MADSVDGSMIGRGTRGHAPLGLRRFIAAPPVVILEMKLKPEE